MSFKPRLLRHATPWLSLSVLLACQPEKVPVSIQVEPMGRIRLFRPPESVTDTTAMRLFQGDSLTLRFQPSPLTAQTCDPFIEGELDLQLEDAAGHLLQTERLSTSGIPFQPVPGLDPEGPQAYLLSPLPLTLERPAGCYTLRLRWRCQPHARAHEQKRILWLDLAPDRQPSIEKLWQVLPTVLDALPPPAPSTDARNPLSPLPVAPLMPMLAQLSTPVERLALLKRSLELLFERRQFEAMWWVALQQQQEAEGSGFLSEQVVAAVAQHEALRELGKLDAASEALERALQLSHQFGYVARLEREYYSQAILLFHRRHLSEALEAAQHSADAAARAGRRDRQRDAELLQLHLLQRLGFQATVRQRLENLLREPMPPEPLRDNNLGWLLLTTLVAGSPPWLDAKRTHAEATRLFESALAHFSKTGILYGVAHVRSSLAQLELLQGQPERAASHLNAPALASAPLDAELQLFLALLRTEVKRQRGQVSTQADFEAQEQRALSLPTGDLYRRMAAFGVGRSLEDEGKLEQALQAYTRALAQAQRPSKASPEESTTLAAQRFPWEGRAILTQLKLGHIWEALEAVELARQRERQQVLAEIRGTPSDIVPTFWKDWRQLVQRLPAGARVLRFATLPEAVVVWELSQAGLQHRVEALPFPTLSLQLAKLEQEGLDSRHSVEILNELSRNLLRSLWEAPYATPSSERLYLVPDGPLRNLPWGALPLHGQPLATRQALVLLPHLPAPSEAVPTTPSTSSLLIVADPDGSLPLAREEATSIAQLQPDATRWVGTDANRMALTQELSRHGFLHFAGHALAPPLNPLDAGLILAHRERLTLKDLLRWRLPGLGVFLNGCRAGATAQEGQHVWSLADGFVASGARWVIANLWDVPDQTGQTLARAFYAEGPPPVTADEAARRLQHVLKLLEAEPPSRHHPAQRLFQDAQDNLDGPTAARAWAHVRGYTVLAHPQGILKPAREDTL